MFIELANNNGTAYLRIVEGYTFTKNGAKKHKRRIVRNIGPLSRFDDGKPEYLSRLRRSFAEGKPLIDSISDLTEDMPIRKKITIEFDVSDDSQIFCKPRGIGYFLLDAMYDSLGIYDVFNKQKSKESLSFDLNGAVKLLVFGRALEPTSKLSTFAQRNNYLFPVVGHQTQVDTYRALDELNRKSETVQKRMNLKIRQSIGRNTEVCFYDVTNYYFEIGENDADELDTQGAVLAPGLRKKGVSKEKRGEPIVQMGLFMDNNGIPISYQLFPGNHTDTTTLRPAMKKTIENMNFDRVIIVADGGLNSGPNITHILDGGNGYIVSKSTKKSDKTVKAWILDEAGYKWNDAKTFKVKSQIRTRSVKAEDGSSREITEKLVCFWSKKHYDRERHENEKFIEYLNSVIANPDKLKDKSMKVEKFLEKTTVDRKTGEVVNAATSLSIDMVKVQEYLDLMGYYTIMTSELDESDEEIISKYHGLSRIEDSFRITKSDLEGRPVFVRTPEHINAHFLICFIALTMIRLIQHEILIHQCKTTNSTENWESGLSAERIQSALREWQADPLPGGYYRITKPSADLEIILSAFGIDGNLKIPIEPELRQLKYSIDKSVMC